MKKIRLDLLVQQQHPELSRAQIQSFIMQGKVLVNDHPITKPGTSVAPDAPLTLTVAEPPYVSRAGLKLEHALAHYKFDVTNLVALDAGLSTGGFTDCLLKHGVAKVYGVDVGHGQVHEKIRTNPRVIVMEKTNLRTMAPLPEKVDLVTLDLSFISIAKVLDTVVTALKSNGHLIALIKPQFEAGRELVGPGGIISDPAVHQQVVTQVLQDIRAHGFVCQAPIESPILGAEGNKEFLVLCQPKAVPD
jgi:23S rRNA (cytidine1920-2'-O)/16S rRNA (cytidine1409-2'-O)-methyltransferase